MVDCLIQKNERQLRKPLGAYLIDEDLKTQN